MRTHTPAGIITTFNPSCLHSQDQDVRDSGGMASAKHAETQELFLSQAFTFSGQNAFLLKEAYRHANFGKVCESCSDVLSRGLRAVSSQKWMTFVDLSASLEMQCQAELFHLPAGVR